MFACSDAALPVASAAGCRCHTPEAMRVTRRLNAAFSRRNLLAGGAALAAGFGQSRPAAAHVPAAPTQPILFTNLRLFDGTSDNLRAGLRVRVTGKTITAIEPQGDPLPTDATIIDCGGRTLMPGLIDAHWHTMMAALPIQIGLSADVGYLHLAASAEAERTLMRGFTTVRDAGGPSFSLKRTIDAGQLPGPRIYPSGAMISQTSGHGDFRSDFEVPRTALSPLSRGEEVGATAIADGTAEVLRRTREQLLLGASQIKAMAGGGVSSPHDPLDVTQYTQPELEAAVQAAADWGTYVCVHVYTPAAIQRAIAAGVKCIEHGHLADAATVRLMAEKDIWWSLQPFLDNEFSNKYPDAERRAKLRLVTDGTDTAYGLAKKYQVKLAWGTDILFDPKLAAVQGGQLAVMTRWFTPSQALRMATSGNAALLALSGPRNPYPGKLGVIEAGAYADLLVIDGDPTTDLTLVANPEKNLRIIMKDGRLHKQTL